MGYYTNAWFIRDILKLYSGTQSGTPVSDQIFQNFHGFLMRGDLSKSEFSNSHKIRHKIRTFEEFFSRMSFLQKLKTFFNSI